MNYLTFDLIIRELTDTVEKMKKGKPIYVCVSLFFAWVITFQNGISIGNTIFTIIIALIIYTLLYNFTIGPYKSNLQKVKQKQFYIQKEKVRDIQHYTERHKGNDRKYIKIIFTNNDSVRFRENELDTETMKRINSFSLGQVYYLVYTKQKKNNKLCIYYLEDNYDLYYQLELGETLDGKLLS